uniref:Cation/H(+) antiporter 15-like n=1 Tax=Heterorhabditis bacteriophora TaxID=37862 RepID=A0A1I7X3F3_HETBA
MVLHRSASTMALNCALKNAKDAEEQKISATRVGPMGILDQAFGDEQFVVIFIIMVIHPVYFAVLFK